MPSETKNVSDRLADQGRFYLYAVHSPKSIGTDGSKQGKEAECGLKMRAVYAGI
ncbi:hypothetical protein VF724_17165 [Paenibacillaceae bacterium T2]|uniref:Uncharacterized protein n=1 Tax=Ferviditalea candida TaxID=3108399 RepID=A0ABU5ZNV8_9BACL|nr:hypothetical protein [Paenibacillaceae bacterium T2]